MVSTQSPWTHESASQAARGKDSNLFTWEKCPHEIFFLTELRVSFSVFKLLLTCVAQSRLQLCTPLIVPLAGLRFPFDVHLYTILAFPRILLVLAIVRFTRCPVACLCCQSFVGPHPGPDVMDLADADPIVALLFGQPATEMLDLPLVLDGHHVCVALFAPGSCIRPVHGGAGVVVGPAFYTTHHAHHWGRETETYFRY